MSLITRILSVGLTALAASLLWLGVALAQSGGCSTRSQRFARRPALSGRLTIIEETGARYSLADRNGDGKLDAARLQGKALLLDLPRRDKPTGFEVITPQAIAAVRGTRWAVDVAARQDLGVRRQGPGRRAAAGRDAAVVLGPGEGVDVEAGGAALTVKRWPAARVAALMARLGQ